MDHLDLRGGDLEIDLESGGNTSEEDGGKHQNLRSVNSNEGLHEVWSEFLGHESPDSSGKATQSVCSFGKVLSSDEKMTGIFGEEVANFAEKKTVQEKTKKPKSKWPPRPPRPPGGPSLEPADMKLVKEISELAILKRKRTERRKALEKLRKEKTSSSTSMLAMVVTILFLFVIIFQGNYFFQIGFSL